MRREDLLEFLDYEKRIENSEKIYDAIESWASNKKLEEIIEAAFEHGFAAAEVMSSARIHSDEHFNERRAVWKYYDPIYDDLCYPFALHLGKTPGSIKWSMRPVGFDNEHVFRRVLGISESELEELYRKGVIGKWDASIPTAAPPEGKEGRILY